MTERTPFWRADPRVWPLIVETMAGREWPPEVVDEDLAWHEDQIRRGYVASLPSRRELAARWGWGDKRTRLRLVRLGGETGAQRGPNRVPTGSQQGPNEGPSGNGSSCTIATEGPSRGPAGAQPGPTKGPAGSTRALVPESREQSPESRDHTPPAAAAVVQALLLSPPPPAAQPDPWDVLADHYAALPWARRPANRKAGNGKHLAAILKAVGLDDARTLLDWWATSPDDRACGLRNGFDKGAKPREIGAAPAYGLETIARRVEEYAERAVDWRARGSPQWSPWGSHGAGYTRPAVVDDGPDLTF